MHRFSEWSLPFRFFNQNFVCISHPSWVLCASAITPSLTWSS
jgi:hypothetical protein